MNRLEDEEERTRRAVNEAARETDEEEVEPESFTDEPVATLAPVGPDLVIFIAANPEKGRYSYRLVDRATGMGHRCVRVALEAEGNGTALSLLAVSNALKSILKPHVNGLVMIRYGFSSRKAAVASRQRLKVRLVVTDRDLASLGRVVTEPGDKIPLEFNESDRSIWREVATQTRRFDVSWSAITPTAAILAELEAWANKELLRAALDISLIQSLRAELQAV